MAGVNPASVEAETVCPIGLMDLLDFRMAIEQEGRQGYLHLRRLKP